MTIDLYQHITDQLVAALEAGTRPWQRDWTATGLPLRHNGAEYQGINCLWLSMIGAARGFTSPFWLTFNQAKALGAAVRKGETSSPVIFYKPLTVDAGEGEKCDDNGQRTVRLLKSYRVFNADQIDGLPDRYAARPAPALHDAMRDGTAEDALRASGAIIREGGDQAYYSPSTDHVQMPPFSAFRTVGGYLATLAHELTHWTGGKARLDRDMAGGFGSKSYAFEELVAEIGASFVCARLGVAGEHLDNHAAYLASWLKYLKDDKRAIFRAASLAQKAADMVLAHAETSEHGGKDEVTPDATCHHAEPHGAQLTLAL